MSADLPKKFRRAVQFVQDMPKDAGYESPAAEKLELYALYKQGSAGPCKEKAPSRLNVVARAKWDAYNKLGKMSKDEAMKKYIQKIVEISKKISGKESEAFRKEMEGVTAKL